MSVQGIGSGGFESQVHAAAVIEVLQKDADIDAKSASIERPLGAREIDEPKEDKAGTANDGKGDIAKAWREAEILYWQAQRRARKKKRFGGKLGKILRAFAKVFLGPLFAKLMEKMIEGSARRMSRMMEPFAIGPMENLHEMHEKKLGIDDGDAGGVVVALPEDGAPQEDGTGIEATDGSSGEDVADAPVDTTESSDDAPPKEEAIPIIVASPENPTAPKPPPAAAPKPGRMPKRTQERSFVVRALELGGVIQRNPESTEPSPAKYV